MDEVASVDSGAIEADIREGVCWWEFVTSSKMLVTRRLQRLWQKQQFLARVAGDLDYIDMQAGVKLESESKGFVSGARRGRVGAHRFFSKLRHRLAERRAILDMERFLRGLGIELDVEAFVKCCRGNMDLSEDDASVPCPDMQQMGVEDEEEDAEYVEYIEAPEFYVVDAECYYGEVNMESVAEENSWADMGDCVAPVVEEKLSLIHI